MSQASLLRKWAEDPLPRGLVVAVRPHPGALRDLAFGAAKAGRYVIGYGISRTVALGDFWNRVVPAPEDQPWPEQEMISLLYLNIRNAIALKAALERFLPYLAPGGQVVFPGYFSSRYPRKTVLRYFPRLNREPAQVDGDTLAIQPVSPVAGGESPVHITVIMAASNRDLRLPLECLRQQSNPPGVVIVDGGGNIFPEAMEKIWFKVQADPGQPFHEARLKNAGLLATVTSHVLFLNADVLLPPGHIDWLRGQFREKPHLLFTVPLIDVDEETTAQWRETGKPDWDYGFGLRGGAYGDHIACEGAFLKVMGGWDETFVGAGVLDDHLVARWMAAGRLVMSAPPCFHLWHPGRRMYWDEWKIYEYKFRPVEAVVNQGKEWGMAFLRNGQQEAFEERVAWFRERKREVAPEELREGEWKEWVKVESPV